MALHIIADICLVIATAHNVIVDAYGNFENGMQYITAFLFD